MSAYDLGGTSDLFKSMRHGLAAEIVLLLSGKGMGLLWTKTEGNGFRLEMKVEGMHGGVIAVPVRGEDVVMVNRVAAGDGVGKRGVHGESGYEHFGVVAQSVIVEAVLESLIFSYDRLLWLSRHALSGRWPLGSFWYM